MPCKRAVPGCERLPGVQFTVTLIPGLGSAPPGRAPCPPRCPRVTGEMLNSKAASDKASNSGPASVLISDQGLECPTRGQDQRCSDPARQTNASPATGGRHSDSTLLTLRPSLGSSKGSGGLLLCKHLPPLLGRQDLVLGVECCCWLLRHGDDLTCPSEEHHHRWHAERTFASSSFRRISQNGLSTADKAVKPDLIVSHVTSAAIGSAMKHGTIKQSKQSCGPYVLFPRSCQASIVIP